ncbi:hypothetical protein FACS1894141_2490 [Spirochaetia bacterium]|nr:hypothetical protein FACS1894141_2490 [Spirochaetia bacterium]
MRKGVLFLGMLGMVLAFGALTGCTTVGIKEKVEGTVYNIGVPAAKDIKIIGLVFVEVEVDSNGNGESITYDALLKAAEAKGGNGIVNTFIDRKAEKTKLFGITIKSGKTTWFGAALAIKYLDDNLATVTVTESEGKTVTSTSTPAAGGGSSGGGGLGGLFK